MAQIEDSPTGSRHLVDPQLLPAIDALPPMTFSYETLEEVRATIDTLSAGYRAPANDGIVREEIVVPGFEGAPGVRVLTYARADRQAGIPAVLYIHGGGFFSGRAEHSEAWCRHLVGEIDCLLVAVDYRLAPETPFPGALEDCYAVLRWIHASAADLGIDPDRIALQGVSAGGGLAAGLTLLARDRGEVPIAFQLLVYPMLDDRTGLPGVERAPFTGEFAWTYQGNGFGWHTLLGDATGGDEVSPYAAPARAESLEGLPPAFIGVGAIDTLMAENVDYAMKLLASGVPTELRVYPGAYHGFDVFDGGQSTVGDDFRCDQITSLRRATAKR